MTRFPGNLLVCATGWPDGGMLPLGIMPCAECGAFTAAYKMASDDYAKAAAALHKLASRGEFRSVRYPKIKAEVERARDVCEMAREALRVHQEGHRNLEIKRANAAL